MHELSHLHKTINTINNSYNMQKQTKMVEIFGGEAIIYLCDGVRQFKKWLHKEK